mmetsp:Transcript_7290/g.6535  ORF Transcript_7290/g.6535 Transcript_7290/m.6535 type:complete len:423 (-) Transcript_7290:112-1380(-)
MEIHYNICQLTFNSFIEELLINRDEINEISSKDSKECDDQSTTKSQKQLKQSEFIFKQALLIVYQEAVDIIEAMKSLIEHEYSFHSMLSMETKALINELIVITSTYLQISTNLSTHLVDLQRKGINAPLPMTPRSILVSLAIHWSIVSLVIFPFKHNKNNLLMKSFRTLLAYPQILGALVYAPQNFFHLNKHHNELLNQSNEFKEGVWMNIYEFSLALVFSIDSTFHKMWMNNSNKLTKHYHIFRFIVTTMFTTLRIVVPNEVMNNKVISSIIQHNINNSNSNNTSRHLNLCIELFNLLNINHNTMINNQSVLHLSTIHNNLELAKYLYKLQQSNSSSMSIISDITNDSSDSESSSIDISSPSIDTIDSDISNDHLPLRKRNVSQSNESISYYKKTKLNSNNDNSFTLLLSLASEIVSSLDS